MPNTYTYNLKEDGVRDTLLATDFEEILDPDVGYDVVMYFGDDAPFFDIHWASDGRTPATSDIVNSVVKEGLVVAERNGMPPVRLDVVAC